MSIPKVKRFENGKEIVGQVDTPYEITWDEWQLLSDAEKEKRKWLITDVPGADGFITVENLKLLWTNPSPTSAFAAQTITLASDDYDFLMFECTMATTSDRRMSFIGSKSAPVLLASFPTQANPGVVQVGTFTRLITKVSDTSFSIADAYKTWYNTSSMDNTLCIPVAIYGFKKQTEIRFNALAQNVKATVDYSTDEHPIGTWIDGSTLYEKTIDCGAMPVNTYKSVPHSISNIDKIVHIEGVSWRNSKITQPIPYSTGATLNGNCEMYVDATYVNISTSSNAFQNNVATYVTIRYTKTS